MTKKAMGTHCYQYVVYKIGVCLALFNGVVWHLNAETTMNKLNDWYEIAVGLLFCRRPFFFI